MRRVDTDRRGRRRIETPRNDIDELGLAIFGRMPPLQEIARDALARKRRRAVDQKRQHIEPVQVGTRDDMVVIVAT